MTEGQLEVRRQRAKEDVFVITAFENGWRVRSARTPSRFYLVSMNGTGLRCTCPDFEQNAAHDPAWQCKHVLAVQGRQVTPSTIDPEDDHELAEERAAVQAESAPQTPSAPQNGPFQMLLKRSISPDGRIDSLSVEFAFALDESSAPEIKSRALKTLKLQDEIVQGFLQGANEKANSRTRDNNTRQRNNQSNRTVNGDGGPPQTNGAIFGRLIDIGLSKSQYGPRFYLNVQVNGRTARFFGTAAQIANAITTAGERLQDNDIEPGLRLDLPCRVLTEKSPDGRYINVTRVLPLQSSANGGARQ